MNVNVLSAIVLCRNSENATAWKLDESGVVSSDRRFDAFCSVF